VVYILDALAYTDGDACLLACGRRSWVLAGVGRDMVLMVVRGKIEVGRLLVSTQIPELGTVMPTLVRTCPFGSLH